MARQLSIAFGQYSDKGRKKLNQDYVGFCIPKEPMLSAKGVAVAIADGISTSQVSQEASQAAVKSFLIDYYCTSEAWSVKKSAERVISATNSWLYAQTRNTHCYDKNRGYVCTFSAIVIKSNTLHVLHIGDSRVYRWRGNVLECLTDDHRFWLSSEESYLSKALGVTPRLEIDYQSLTLQLGDVLLLATDGVYESFQDSLIAQSLVEHGDDLNRAAQVLAEHAFAQGSSDNLSVQILRIDSLPSQDRTEVSQQLTDLTLPPILDARMDFDGYKIIRELHASARSHVYLAEDKDTKVQVALKCPAVDLSNDTAALERFLMESWIQQRINSPYVLKPYTTQRKQNYIYIVTEYIEGQTLKQWMFDHPKPDLETVRQIIEQIGKGLRAFHYMEMLHQDIRPDNILIERGGTVKIIDFGSTWVAGIMESVGIRNSQILGTLQYTAPEYFLDENGTPLSDQFSLAVLTYHMLTGQLPYGVDVPKAKTRVTQMKLSYEALNYYRRDLPPWLDEVLKKALHLNPYKRYADVAEFTYELRHPNQAFLNKTRSPLLERDPVAFWKGLSGLLLLIVILLMAKLP